MILVLQPFVKNTLMLISEEDWKEIKQNPLLRDFTEEEYAILSECWEKNIYPKDEMIVIAGQINQDLCLIGKGAITFIKPSSYDPNRKTAYRLHSMDLFGEFSFVHSSPQLYDVKAVEDGTIIYRLSRIKLLQQEHSSAIYDKLLFNLVRMELDGSRQPPQVLEESHFSKMLPKKASSLQTLKREFLMLWLPQEFTIQERRDIEEVMNTQGLSEGEDCLKQDEVADRFYLLLEGQLEVLQWDEVKHLHALVDLIEAGDSFGENCLLKPTPAPYTIRARRPSVVLILERAQLKEANIAAAGDKLLLHLAQYQTESPDFIKKIYHYSASIPVEFTSQPARLQFLRNCYLTEEFTSEEIAQLNNMLELQEYESGEIVIQENEMSRDLYFLLRGKLSLLKWNEAQANYVVINKLQPGDIFGEFSFVDGLPRSVTIKTLTKTQVLRLPFNKFSEQATHTREVYRKLLTNGARLIQQRLQSGKEKEIALLSIEIRQLQQRKRLWILLLGGLILVFIEPLKLWNPAIAIGLTILQFIVPVLIISRLLKESLSDWGLSMRWIIPSIVQAIIVIAVAGGVYGLSRQFEGVFTIHTPHLLSWHDLGQLSLGSLFSYSLFVVIEEWLKRGIVVSSLQRILEDPKGRWSAFLSACLFLGRSLLYSPLLSLAFFLKDLALAYLFARAPQLIGVILIHFTLGVLLALLGWFTL